MFELGAACLGFIVSARAVAPVEFSGGGMATFRGGRAFGAACF